eukprot:TRINITY_DN2970_c1_g4_i1.p1 TRINITY_DN2970_c1_g4~~TRINITY_DN2970_c1_g4_i1.p1  ORF type:complete len:518 (-),score=88.99 TRINITY_DN2970_c1_g4_i1:156-1628(-)
MSVGGGVAQHAAQSTAPLPTLLFAFRKVEQPVACCCGESRLVGIDAIDTDVVTVESPPNRELESGAGLQQQQSAGQSTVKRRWSSQVQSPTQLVVADVNREVVGRSEASSSNFSKLQSPRTGGYSVGAQLPTQLPSQIQKEVKQEAPTATNDDMSTPTTIAETLSEVACASTPATKPTRSFSGSYELFGRLNGGAFGVVHRCTSNLDGSAFVVKTMQKRCLTPSRMISLFGSLDYESEMALHGSVGEHPNIAQMHEFFEDAKEIKIVMDYCEGGDLFEEIKRCLARRGSCFGNFSSSKPGIDPEAARRVGQQLLAAVAHCHSMNICHRDVKAENVLLDQPSWVVPLTSPEAVFKLCDFGLAVRMSPEEEPKVLPPVGSPDTVAPEVVRGRAYDRKVDVWSSGIVLFECLRGTTPFASHSDQETLTLVKRGRVKYDRAWDRLPLEARSTVESLLVATPAKRPTASSVLDLSAWLRASATASSRRGSRVEHL